MNCAKRCFFISVEKNAADIDVNICRIASLTDVVMNKQIIEINETKEDDRKQRPTSSSSL